MKLSLNTQLLKQALKQWEVKDTPANQTKVQQYVQNSLDDYGYYHELVREMLEGALLEWEVIDEN